jgi:hypothetical protein
MDWRRALRVAVRTRNIPRLSRVHQAARCDPRDKRVLHMSAVQQT